ncbi:MAG TPA: PHP domain-containing protein [Dermatophilaceae bacterium]|nr:PHP domain-containing protein [Dermatophilaceae bacterium]
MDSPLAPLAAPVDPVPALRRVAFLLERKLAGRYRVEAFRGAVTTLKTLEEDEVAARVAAGTLQELPGVGKTTAAVVSEAVRGELPAYLASLQDKSGGPLAAGGADLYAGLRGDCHLHSDWSDGGSPIDEMVLTGVELGHDWMVLTDHSPSLRVANGLSVERLRRQLAIVDAIDAAAGEAAGRPFRLLKGIEVDILDDGSLDQTAEMLRRLDLVTASVHSKLRMNREPMTRRMVAAVSDPRVNVLGHCTGRLVTGGRGTRPQSEFDARAVFEACAEHGTAVEINSRPERCDPPDDLIAVALEAGCLFAIDSDAHAPGQLDMKAYGCERAERLGVPAERIVTAWPVGRVLEWTAAGRAA